MARIEDPSKYAEQSLSLAAASDILEEPPAPLITPGSDAMTRLSALLVTLVLTIAPRPTSADEVDYVRDVKPIFVKHCVKCHNEKRQESGLRLDRAGGVLLGGDGGAVVVKNESANSRLIEIVSGQDDDVGIMPPEGPTLTEAEIAILRAWIDQGVAAPDDELDLTTRSDHWAFQPITRPPLPAVKSPEQAGNAIDLFILAKLEAPGATPSKEAGRATLIRRLSLDLRGFPPTPAEVEQFRDDGAPGAYERLVDRMLASPAYGERWGRHWLDLARYADSNGFTRDFGREIWKYREWVIAAINADVPFDRFTLEQYAGDMLPDPRLDQLIATGFHRNTLINEEGGTDDEQFRVDAIADRVNTTGVVYLGLTLGCARCHQHKYDPISQREYYQLFAFLNNCDEPKIDAPADWQVASGILDRRQAIRDEIKAKEQQLAEKQGEFTKAQLAWEAAITPEFRVTLPGPTQEALLQPHDKRDDAQKKLIADLFKTQAEAKKQFPLVDQIAKLRSSEPVIPTTMVLKRREEPRQTHIHRRGNFLDKGARVTAAVPDVLHSLPDEVNNPTRMDFANWLTSPDNPLTPRVIVNRYWQRFFGVGIVETENDFGVQGIPPTHPELLDWLASEFVSQDWSVKQIHRLIVTSATYRQSSRHREDLAKIDPYNKLLGRQSRVRLDAEIVRDNALAAGGLLSRKMGGPSVFPPQPDGVFEFTQDPKPWKTESNEDRYRRGMYTHFWRSSPYPALMVFDAPNGNVTCTRRVRSNTPLQSLTLANDVQFVECAQQLARDIIDTGFATDYQRVAYAFKRCLVRRPSDIELLRLMDLVEQQRASFVGDQAAAAKFVGSETASAEQVELAVWTATARVLMNLDEFITRE